MNEPPSATRVDEPTCIPAEPIDVGLSALPARPITLHVLVDLARSLDRERMELAMERTERAFPVLGCRLAGAAVRDRWVRCGKSRNARSCDVSDVDDREEATRALVASEWDIRSERPWRIAFLRHGKGGRLVVSVRHEVADGAGALAAVHELGRHLAGGEPRPTTSPRSRGYWRLLRAFPARRLPALVAGLLDDLLLPARSLCFARPLAGAEARRTGAACWRTVEADVGPTGSFRRRCAEAGATVNDGLVAALLVCASRLGTHGDPACFFTADMRRLAPGAPPAVANLSSGQVISLPRRQSGSFDDAILQVVRRTERSKRAQPGLGFFLVNCTWAFLVPSAAVRLAAPLFARWASALLGRCLSVTNLGPVDGYVAPLGDDVESATVVGPALSLSPVPLLAATSFRDRLAIQVNGYADDSTLLDRVAAEVSSIVK